MKNVKWLTSAQEYDDFYESVWRTDFFKEKAKNDVWLSGILKFLRKMPHAVADQVYDVERLHFSTFWNVWIFHDHKNDYIYDLGVLHELLHTVLFQKSRIHADTPEEWRKMPLAVMEMAVSLRTEVFVYLRWPELRQHTFKQEIWADRYMNTSVKKIKEDREYLSTAFDRGVEIKDVEDLRIANYAEMNKVWVRDWEGDGMLIESAWKESSKDKSKTVALFEAEWAKKMKDGVPFHDLATAGGIVKKRLDEV